MYAAYHLSMLRPKFVADSFHFTASTSLVTWAHLVQDPETLEVAGSSAVPHWHPHNSQARQQGQLGKWPAELQGTPCAGETALCKCGMWKFGAIGIPVEVKWSRTPVLLSGWTTKVYTIYIYQFTDPFTLLEMAHFRKPSPGKIIITTPQVMWSCYMMLHTFMEENYRKSFAARYGDIGEMPTTFAQADSQILLIWKKMEWMMFISIARQTRCKVLPHELSSRAALELSPPFRKHSPTRLKSFSKMLQMIFTWLITGKTCGLLSL